MSAQILSGKIFASEFKEEAKKQVLALKEQYNAILVGKKTYGKGTVQELLKTRNGIQYKITTQHWLTSKGNWIDKQGIDVDYDVE